MILDLARRFGIYALLAAAIVFLWFRLDAASDLAESRQQTIDTKDAIIASRDGLIAQQNDAIQSLAERREEGRVVYLQDYARADAAAVSHDNHAAELLALRSEFTDELSECRAAKTLLQKELIP